MRIKLTFLGAARNVTGSCYLLEANESRILVDCGMYQEREFRNRNWEPFKVPPDTINAVLVTHAHVDHIGLLPKLCRDGFKGPVYCTEATAEIAQIILMDAAHLQEEDAEFKRKRHEREGRKGPYPEVPLYTVADAQACQSRFSPIKYGETVRLGDGMEAVFSDAGHVLGSAMIKVAVRQGGVERSIIFSGDIGRWGRPILRNPNIFSKTDYVVIESTYGDRLHEDTENIKSTLAEIVNSTYKARGNIIVPSFALHRTQEMLYYMNDLLANNRVPRIMVYVDSPMAISITQVYERHTELFDREMRSLVRNNLSPFEFSGLKMVQTADESKALNDITDTIMILAGSGMCTGGRIKHHLVNNIFRAESTILFVGYQAVGTLGRQIVDGAEQVRILGKTYPVRARIAQLQGLSAHADSSELLEWLSVLGAAPRRVFVTHGEAETAEHFSDLVRERTGWKTSVPDYMAEVFLD